MKKVFLMLLILSYQQLSVAQCSKKWKPGNPIGYCKPLAWPQSYQQNYGAYVLKSVGGTIINFSVSFDDIDEVITPNTSPCVAGGGAAGSERRQAPNAKYQVMYKIEDVSKASFDAVSDIFEYQDYASAHESNTELCKDKPPTVEGNIWSSSVPLYIKTAFSSGDIIKVRVEVTDVTPLPLGDTGNLTDPPLIYTWEIHFDDVDCPSRLVLANLTHNNEWRTAPLIKPVVDYTYLCVPFSAPRTISPFRGKLINESFGKPFSDGFFELSDLDLSRFPSTIRNLELAAWYIFRPFVSVKPATFVISKGGSFQDSHGAIKVEHSTAIGRAFGATGIENNKVGFSVWQKYTCGTGILDSVKLSKRIFFEPGSSEPLQIRKIH
jgi:hypothetical protein